MEQIIDKKGIEFDIELINVTPLTGEVTYIYSERSNSGMSKSIYDQPSLMRVLCQKSQIISDDIITQLYSLDSSSTELAFILDFSSFRQLVCLVHIENYKSEFIGKVISVLKKNKVQLLNQCKLLIPKSNAAQQVFNSGIRAFPRYSTKNLNAKINIIGVNNEIKLVNSSIGGISIEVAAPSSIIENIKRVEIQFSKFKYNFMVSIMWTNTNAQRITSAGIRLDFQTKQELLNWQTFIYALFIKQKK